MISVNRNIIFLFLASLMSCVESFDPKLGGEDVQRLVVEAQLTTKMDYQYVYLTFDAPFNSNINNFTYLVTRAKISITDDLGNTFDFYDQIENNNQIITKQGYNYRSVDKFKAEVGRKYQLNVELLDGRKKYQSGLESVIPISKIDKVSTEFQELVPPNDIKGQYHVFIDTKDSPTERNFYKWDTYHIKQLNYCREWYIYEDGGVAESLVDKCCELCFEKVQNESLFELANDRLINGNRIEKKYVTTIPYDNYTPYYLVINQYSLSESAYKYFYDLKQQGRSSGGLFDVVPKSIKGNMKSLTDPSEEVLGLFYVSDSHEYQINIDRNRISPKPIIKEEYTQKYTKTDQCYPCEEKYNRTKTKPTGWFN